MRYNINKKSASLGFSIRGDNREFNRGNKSSSVGNKQYGRTHRRRFSTYGYQNKEKNKLMFYFGLKEKQLQNIFTKSKKRAGSTTVNMMNYLISRLDNLASFFVSTRKMSRQ